MKIQYVKGKARKLEIKPGRMKKADLIKAIQRTEGNFECFETAVGHCDQLNCCWRDDCLKK